MLKVSYNKSDILQDELCITKKVANVSGLCVRIRQEYPY